MLGSAHLGDLIRGYTGSYIMSIAAYNAGGSRVSQWSDLFGDPRSPTVDPIDWVENIPFSETRNYVQRVLENTEVYRTRLNGGGQKVKIDQDLRRNTSMAVTPATPVQATIPAAVPSAEPAAATTPEVRPKIWMAPVRSPGDGSSPAQ
jgi:soluble lytic murein transglycosylase